MEQKKTEYKSCFAESIENFVNEKKSLGYAYKFQSEIFAKFDKFCIDNRINSECITNEITTMWELYIENTGKSYKEKGISCICALSEYLCLHGKESFIPQRYTNHQKVVPHVLSKDEITAFFTELDKTYVKCNNECFSRMAVEYKVFFRLVYCCGLRNSEACNLKIGDLDLENKRITINHSKGDKDRYVYFSNDLQELLRKYIQYLHEYINSEFLFPGQNSSEPVIRTSISRKFNEIWNRTDYSKFVDKKPTVHSLRHSFVVNRINSWIDQSIDIKELMPYLSKFLGHSSIEETFYYYHMTKDGFKRIRDQDYVLDSIIPEVEYEE